jgi:NADH-ubiquinone oxidoreductase chain 1
LRAPRNINIKIMNINFKLTILNLLLNLIDVLIVLLPVLLSVALMTVIERKELAEFYFL